MWKRRTVSLGSVLFSTLTATVCTSVCECIGVRHFGWVSVFSALQPPQQNRTEFFPMHCYCLTFFAKRRPHFFLPSSHSHTKFLFRRLSRASNVHQNTYIENCSMLNLHTEYHDQRKNWRRLALNINTDANASSKEKIDTRSKENVFNTIIGIGYFYALDASCT